MSWSSTTSPGARHHRPASIVAASIAALGAGRPEKTWPRIWPPFGKDIPPRTTGQGPALALTPAAPAVAARRSGVIAPADSMTRWAPFAAVDAPSDGAWDSTRML